MNKLIQLKQQVIEKFFGTPTEQAKGLTQRLLEDGRITMQEFIQLNKGFEKTEVHILVDNHVDVIGTHWGNIATGNAQTGAYK